MIFFIIEGLSGANKAAELCTTKDDNSNAETAVIEGKMPKRSTVSVVGDDSSR